MISTIRKNNTPKFLSKEPGNFDSLKEFEYELENFVEEVEYLGQFDLGPGGFELLEEMVKNLIKNSQLSLDKVFENYPNSVSLYLVLKGVFSYDGKYWTHVREAITIDPNTQNLLGAKFLDYLRNKDMVLIEDPPGFKYRDNILIQGLLPLSCLEDFLGHTNPSKFVPGKEVGWELSKKADGLRASREVLAKLKEDLYELKEGLREYPQILLKVWGELEELEKLEDELVSNKELLSSLDGNPKKIRKKNKLKLFARQRHSKIINNFLGVLSNDNKKYPLAKQKSKLTKKLQEVNSEKKAALKRVNKIDRAARELSDGNFTDRMSRLADLLEEEKLERKKEELSGKIGTKYGLAKLRNKKTQLDEEVKDENITGKEYLEKKISEEEKLKRKKEDLEQKISSFEGDLREYEAPTKNFLMYGKNFPEFFKNEVEELRRNLSSEQDLENHNYDLPQRYINVLLKKEWSESEEDSESDKKSERKEDRSSDTRQRLRAPKMVLGASNEKIKIEIPSQIIRNLEGAKNTRFCVSNECEPLKAFIENQEYYRTEEAAIEPKPKFRYPLKLKKGDKTLKRWQCRARLEKRPYFVFDSNRELYKEKQLTQETVWLALPEGLAPEGKVELAGQLSNKWSEYRYYKVDLSERTRLLLDDETGEKISVSIEQETLSPIKPEVGRQVKGVELENIPVYPTPPKVRLPLREGESLEEWGMVIQKCEMKNEYKTLKRVNLKEKNLRVPGDGKYYRVDLEDVEAFSKPFGCYRVVVRNSELNYSDYIYFCHLENFSYNFGKSVYLPGKNDLDNIKLEVNLPKELKLEKKSVETYSRSDDGNVETEVPGEKNELVFDLYFPYETIETIYNLNLEVPKIEWTLPQVAGKVLAADSKSSELYFLQDLEKQGSLDLYLYLPSFYSGKAVLVLTDSRKKSKSSVKDGEAKFNLLGFLDALRDGKRSDKTNQTFKVSFPDQEVPKHPVRLFTVQNHWEVTDLNVDIHKDDKINIKATWNVVGKAENQVLIIWRRKEEEKILKENLDTDSESFEKELAPENLERGEYIVEVTNQPPYSGKEIKYPVDSVRDRFGYRIDFQPSTVAGTSERIEHKSYVDNFEI